MSVDKSLSKLAYVHRRAPILLQPKIAAVIEALSNSGPYGVEAPSLQKTEYKNTSLSLLQDNADSFLALMRTLPKKHAFKEAVSEVQSLADKLAEKLEESGQELAKILQTDEEDLPGIKASALGMLAEMLQSEKGKLGELQELTKTLGTLAGKVHKEEKTSPVEHELPSKDLDSGKKKKKEPEGIGDEIEGVPSPGPKEPETGIGGPATPDLSL